MFNFGLRYNQVFLTKSTQEQKKANNKLSPIINGDGYDFLLFANTIKEHGCIGREVYTDTSNGKFDVVGYLSTKTNVLLCLSGLRH